jgi:hypothetical protein
MPSTGTGLKVLSILQNHYVERMGKGLVVNMPYVSSWSSFLITPTPKSPTYQFAKLLPLASALTPLLRNAHHPSRPHRAASLSFPISLLLCYTSQPDTLSHSSRTPFLTMLFPLHVSIVSLEPADTLDGGSTRSLVSSAVPWTLSLGIRSDSTQT